MGDLFGLRVDVTTAETRLVTNATDLVPQLLAWYERSARDLPWRRTQDPYAIWISEVMLQQTQVKTVLPYWRRWMRTLPTVRALARARLDRVLKLWEGLGYYRRARQLHQAAQAIVSQHDGRLPATYRQLVALPGIGAYTAGALCSIAFDQPVPVLDGNVCRVLTRLEAIRAHPRQARVARRLRALAADYLARAARVGPGACGRWNQALMELGALVCVPRQPDCARCPLSRWCKARRLGLVERIPRVTPRPAPLVRHVVALVIRRAQTVLVRRRPAGAVNGGLWEFPSLEVSGAEFDPKAVARGLLGYQPSNLISLRPLRHQITRYRITLHVFHHTVPPGFQAPAALGQWRRTDRLEGLPFARAHRRIAATLE